MKKFLILLFTLLIPIQVFAAPVGTKEDFEKLPNQTELSKYALSWADHTECKYVFGGPGGRSSRYDTLEKCSESGVGFDCSAFTTMVYRHFGIEIYPQSESQLKAAKKIVTVEEAVPGDICYWHGHVAIWLGDYKLVHTNTSSTDNGKLNYVHVDTCKGGGGYYRNPDKILRMVDDISQLKPLGDTASKEVEKEIKSKPDIGMSGIVTESDLTGMPTEWSLQDAQIDIVLPTDESLSDAEKENVTNIKESIKWSKRDMTSIFNIIQTVSGFFIIMYSVFLVLAFLFDYYVGVMVDFSFVKLLTFNTLEVADAEILKDEVKENPKYLTLGRLVFRVFVIDTVGVLLISESISKFIYWLFHILK